MKIRMTTFGVPAALLAASLFAGCSNTARGIQEDTAQNAEKAKEASAEAAAKTERATEDAKVSAERAAEATKDAMGTAGQATREAAEKTAEETKEAAHDAADAAKRTSAEAEVKSKDAAAKTANTMDAAQQTMQIKSALMADKSVDSTRINVDTDGATHTVTLRGYVPNAAQKAAAERIAHSKAPEYRVVNNLVVG